MSSQIALLAGIAHLGVSRRAMIIGAGLSAILGSDNARADPLDKIRLGTLSFGTAAWEIDVIRRHNLARQHHFELEVVSLAGGEAGKVALQSGAVDIIVSDLVWVARQRAEGSALAMMPYSRAVGALVVPAESPVRSLADLAGKRLGVAGGSLDKSWLVLRALAMLELKQDLAVTAKPVFGAAPLISNELETGRLDAALTFWNFAAGLEAQGARPLLTVANMLERLGLSTEVPMLGYAFREDWARRNRDLVDRFAACSRAAKALLVSSDDEWRLLAPLLGTDDPAIQVRLRDGYRSGIPGVWTAREQTDAAKLFSILAALGGEELAGQARSFDPATIWNTTTP